MPDREVAMPKRARPGDVAEVQSSGRRIYLHYLGKHPRLGDSVVVDSTMHVARPEMITAELFRDGYVTFYPLRAAVSQGLAEIVGHVVSAARVPFRLRRPGAIIGRQIVTWVLEDASGPEIVKKSLSDDELRIPIAAIWNHEFLLQRVSEGWRPEQKGLGGREGLDGDRRGVEAPLRSPSGNAKHRFRHYLYFPTRDAASAVAARLREQSFDVEERLGADGVNWLVSARHDLVVSPEIVATVRANLEELAAMGGGEYDGWEVEVDAHSSEGVD